ncbi:Peptidylprolyl isomerase [Pleurostoma richardsiae]|uniref:FK506-binding protein n=1 Tax=Pleurostoma richardsiae TaxID=41990 RepID=A0AA38SF04_9PEZI|nr:Peptidylprolyl isomerase [Pleurostoma richardsiae]
MAPLQPVALFGLEVPPGEVMVPVAAEFPATVRITMAAIDPTEEPEPDEDGHIPAGVPRSTLKLIKQRVGSIDDDDEENDEYLQALLNGEDSEEDSEDDDEEANGGPSDPAKSKKARQDAAIKKLMESVQDDSDEDMEDDDEEPKSNGTKAKKGKEKATEDEDEEDSEEDSDDESDGLDLEQFVVCTLDTERNYQQPLEITVNEDEKVFFIVSGTHTIHLTGNYVIDEDDASDSDEDDEDYDYPPDEDLYGEEYSSEDELDAIEHVGRVQEVDTDEEAPKLVETKKGKNKRPAQDEADGLDELIAKESKAEEKLSKKQAKKLKNNEGKAIAAEEAKKDTPTKGDKKVQFAKNLEQGPTGPAAEKLKQGEKKDEKKVKVVQGVSIDDRKIGTGRTAKAGDRVGMRYIGKLTNGKVFDSNKKGTPFSFKLGKGEVIKGWDIGVAGMAVGGERRLTIPAHLAYGSKGVPGIPGNSTLIFDVKLLEIK